MNDRSRPVPDVVIATFQYRHEAEFAAGFLTDAGIPFRLQVDDAGGADAGVTVSNPARIWVRGQDEEAARELLEVEEEPFHALDVPFVGDEAPAAGTFIPAPASRPGRRVPELTSKLCGAERAVSVAISVISGGLAFGAGPGIGVATGTTLWGALLLAMSVIFALAALTGRAWGPFRSILRSLSGVAP